MQLVLTKTFSPSLLSQQYLLWQAAMAYWTLAKRPLTGAHAMIFLHKTTPTTLPTDLWQSKQNSRNTI
jgi:hypothetical protein